MSLLARLFGPSVRPPLGPSPKRRADAGVGGQWTNSASGMGGPHDRSQSTEFEPGYPVDRGMADSLITYSALARRVVFREAEDCTREGFVVTVDVEEVDKSVAAAIEKSVAEVETLPTIKLGRAWERGYGGAGIVMMIDDGRESHQPVDRANIRRLNGLIAVDRHDLPVVSVGKDRREERTWGKPRTYRLQSSYGASSTVVHADRVIRMGGLPLARRLSAARQGWGGSVLDLIYPQLSRQGVSHVHASEALSLLSQGVLQSAALDAALETEQGPAIVQSRLEAWRRATGMFGEAAIGKDETYTVHSRPMAGVADVVGVSDDDLVAASEMPKAILMGEMPGGLTRSSSPELVMWYDHCAGQHDEFYTPALHQVIDILLLSREGPTAGRVVPYETAWNPLLQEDPVAAATRRLQASQARAADIMARVITPETAATDRGLADHYDMDGAVPPVNATEEPETEDDLPELLGEASPAVASEDPLPADLVDPKDVADRLKVSRRRITNAMNRGEIRWWLVYGSRRVSMSEATAGVTPG